MNIRGSFGMVVIHKKKFVCGCETRGVDSSCTPEEIILDDDNNEEIYTKTLAVYDRIIVQTGNKNFNDDVIAEVNKMLREHKEISLTSMTSAEAAEAFRASSQRVLNEKQEAIRNEIASAFNIASYEGRVPKLVKVAIAGGIARIIPVTRKWSMSGWISSQTYLKITKFLEDELNDELSVEEVAHLVNACVRMVASYAEIEKELGDDTCVGGNVMVGVVHTAKKNGEEKWIQEIDDFRLTADKPEGNKDKKLVYYDFGKIIESRSIE